MEMVEAIHNKKKKDSHGLWFMQTWKEYRNLTQTQ